MSKFKPYLAVITNFKRTNQSIVTLVALSSNRRIDLSADDDIPTTIREHYSKNKGNCSIFGKITKYRSFHSKNEYIEYKVNGVAVDSGVFTGIKQLDSAFLI